MSDYLQKRRDFINAGRPLPPKKLRTPIKKKSDKRAAKEKEQQISQTDDGLDKFFERNRKRMVGVCQCGCGEKSQKKDDTFYRHCICHLFPKRLFPSIATHDLNWVERTFWGGHHTNFDEQGMNKWPLMADWEDIKEKFHQLVPLLTDEERKKKFYTSFEKLVYNN